MGAIHSTDDFNETKSYQFIAEGRGEVGYIEYFIVPISKNGDIGPVTPIGAYIEQD